jgi:hypothetical protein
VRPLFSLPAGMGLERMAQILQGAPNNYETDLIFPMLAKAAEMAGLDYATSSAKQQTNLKVMGDHIRAVVYLISDGVNPSNVGRGYIVRRCAPYIRVLRLACAQSCPRRGRASVGMGEWGGSPCTAVTPTWDCGRDRLLRRVVRCGRLLGIKTTEPFTPILAQVAIDLSGEPSPCAARGSADQHTKKHLSHCCTSTSLDHPRASPNDRTPLRALL